VSILGRFREEPAPVIYSGELGTIRDLPPIPAPGQMGELGTFVAGRPVTGENLSACRKWLLEADAADFEWRSALEVVDMATGRLFEVIASDPLLSEDPGAAADLFFADTDEGVIRFLRSTGTTVAELEAAAVETDRARAKADEEAAKWRARQKRVRLTVNDSGVEFPTLRSAAAEISAAGGRVVRTEAGFAVEVPERIHRPAGSADWASAGLERESRRRLAVCAETLAMAGATVVAAIAEAESSRRELAEVLPDRPPLLGEA
jgi:hypothetical protein